MATPVTIKTTGSTVVNLIARYDGKDYGPNTGYRNPFSTELGRGGEYYCADTPVAAWKWACGFDFAKYCPDFYWCPSFYEYAWESQLDDPGPFFKTVRADQVEAGDVGFMFRGAIAKNNAVHCMVGRGHDSKGVLTIEGDTSNTADPASQTVGGWVEEKTRSYAYLMHWFRPQYTGGGTPKPPIPGGVVGRYPLSYGWFAVNDGTAITHSGIRNNDATYVKEIQTSLNHLEGAKLTVDGRFGPLTKAATVRFQRAAHIGVDGEVGPQTWGVLAIDTKAGKL